MKSQDQFFFQWLIKWVLENNTSLANNISDAKSDQPKEDWEQDISTFKISLSKIYFATVEKTFFNKFFDMNGKFI